jgi:hypothetical protein
VAKLRWLALAGLATMLAATAAWFAWQEPDYGRVGADADRGAHDRTAVRHSARGSDHPSAGVDRPRRANEGDAAWFHAVNDLGVDGVGDGRYKVFNRT